VGVAGAGVGGASTPAVDRDLHGVSGACHRLGHVRALDIRGHVSPDAPLQRGS
jgi:hypothetical protein